MQRIYCTLAVLFFALLGLGACQSGEEILAGMVGERTPAQEFAPVVDSTKLIFVVPVEGMTGAARLVVADAVAALLRDARKPAILAEKMNGMGPTIAGRVVEVNERGSVAWVTMAWELRTPYGTAVAEYRHQVVVDAGLWKAGSAEAINLLISDAGPRIVGMVHDFVSPAALAAPMPAPAPVLAPVKAAAAMPEPVKAAAKKSPPRTTAGKQEQTVASLTKKPPPARNPPPPEKNKARDNAKKMIAAPLVLKKAAAAAKAKPILMPVPNKGPGPLVAPPPAVGWGRPAFLIKKVKGAPGDGNEALTKAIKEALRKNDLTVTEDPRQAGFVIEGSVEVSAPVNGRQQARIVWEVKTMDGDEVGKAVQENAVKAGSLDGAWGRVAEIVSSAAITGIQELFGIEKKQSFRRTKEPKFSGRTDVPRIPGRALPPPE